MGDTMFAIGGVQLSVIGTFLAASFPTVFPLTEVGFLLVLAGTAVVLTQIFDL